MTVLPMPGELLGDFIGRVGRLSELLGGGRFDEGWLRTVLPSVGRHEETGDGVSGSLLKGMAQGPSRKDGDCRLVSTAGRQAG